MQRNYILASLQGRDLASVLKEGQAVDLPVRHVIYGANQPITEAIFPIDAVLSVVTTMREGGAIEVGTIGCEGTSALPIILGAHTTANECYCQVPGTGIQISGDLFRHLRETNTTFAAHLDRYLQGYVNFLGQLAGCNRLHHINQRCARWLLLTHDRVARDDILLTQEYLAMMLGSSRSGVTLALAALQHAKLIRYARGHITILDHQGLEAVSCECYGVAKEQFGGLLRSVY
ncbi:MAG: Crp/Fnr family transcriptional regulator [Candidatus Lustribacter sp.]